VKTDKETKEFIDNREAFTLSELSKFIFGSSQPLITKRERCKDGVIDPKKSYIVDL